MSDLSFNVLREANRRRAPLYKNAKGVLTDGKSWSHNDWMCALIGEVGELANILKKIHRGDFLFEDVYVDVRKELADIACYVDMLADACDVNLGSAVIEKFNEVSVRVNVPIKIDVSGRFVYNEDLDRAQQHDHREG
jgi:NTP pyrophosphatase (non-canonical NTP hydrolase)